MLLIDATTEAPPVLPIHRALLAVPRQAAPGGPDPMGATPRPSTAGERVRDLAEVLASVQDESARIGSAAIEDGELIHRVMTLDGGPPAVRALHQGPLEGIGHGRLAYPHDAVVAEEMVRSGDATAAFFLPPTRFETIRRVIGEGETLPEKSTYSGRSPSPAWSCGPSTPDLLGPQRKNLPTVSSEV